jgi:hypothetical protein
LLEEAQRVVGGAEPHLAPPPGCATVRKAQMFKNNYLEILSILVELPRRLCSDFCEEKSAFHFFPFLMKIKHFFRMLEN